MNKTQLVDALAERLGDRRTASTAVEGLLETIVDTVRSGESVTITGFGVFESRSRAARTARNPRTGEAVDVPATTVPAFRPGTAFRTAVGGVGASTPRATPIRRSTASAVAAETLEPPAAPAKAGKAGKSGGKAGKSGGKAKSNSSFAKAEKPAAKAGKSKKDDKGKKNKKK
jgi:DNA-binding protein HU-beta